MIEIAKRHKSCMTCFISLLGPGAPATHQIGILTICHNCYKMIFRNDYTLITLIRTYEYYHQHFSEKPKEVIQWK